MLHFSIFHTLSFEIQLMKTCFIRNTFLKNLTVNVKNNVISHIAVQPCAVICAIGFVLSKRSKDPWKRSNSCDFKGYWNNWCDLCHVTKKIPFSLLRNYLTVKNHRVYIYIFLFIFIYMKRLTRSMVAMIPTISAQEGPQQ
jgi:hypothetical protein